ncbi:hypothetical protein [Dactylosporangium sp. CA-092794]|uniref:hypothetical protein n=1 Tax=Dactylosporangium sp. CA-092794 TaxID=3239929 RepID=UPI003D944FF7
MTYTLPAQPPSTIAEHTGCEDCATFHDWLLARDRAERELHRGPGPTEGISWPHRYFRWGPIAWPVHWCDLAEARDVDCGVFADLTWHLLRERGVRADRLQICERAAAQETALWRETWLDSTGSAAWILSDVLVYHEALVVHRDGGPAFFDPTERRPTLPSGLGLSGEPVWMRVWPGDPDGAPPRWNGTALAPADWTRVAGDGR